MGFVGDFVAVIQDRLLRVARGGEEVQVREVDEAVIVPMKIIGTEIRPEIARYHLIKQ